MKLTINTPDTIYLQGEATMQEFIELLELFNPEKLANMKLNFGNVPPNTPLTLWNNGSTTFVPCAEQLNTITYSHS